MSLPFDSVSCSQLPDEARCGECGWKCDCYLCKADAQRQWGECQCSCRFWVVTCFAVLLGFFIVFYVAAVMRRVLLYAMASVAVISSAALSAVSASTQHCGWPAFLSIALVFAFPCAYSCCFQFVNRANSGGSAGGGQAGSRSREAEVEAKHSNSVLILFPGGEVQLGVMTQTNEDKEGGVVEEKKKRRRRGLITATSAVLDRSTPGWWESRNERDGGSSNNVVSRNGHGQEMPAGTSTSWVCAHKSWDVKNATHTSTRRMVLKRWHTGYKCNPPILWVTGENKNKCYSLMHHPWHIGVW